MINNQKISIPEQIDELLEIQKEWLKKKNSLRLAEAKLSDVSQLHQITTDLETVEKKINLIETEIHELKLVLSSTSENLPEPLFLSAENSIGDEIKVLEIFKQEVAGLGLHSAKGDFSKLLNIKAKINENLFQELDDKINYISSQKQLVYVSAIFDKIYSSKELDDTLRQEIQKIREDKKTYKDYDRSVIISGLSLSLINFNFDKKKANLLIDFTTDFEDNVWERALTGLMLTLLYHNNKWFRFDDFKKRLEVLKEFERVQEGIKIIDTILKNKLYKMNIFIPNLFENEYFKNPMNCFLPFYKDNEIVQELLDNANREFDIGRFEDSIYQLPVMDTLKYAISMSVLKDDDQKETFEETENRVRKIDLLQQFRINNIFSPYQNLVGEYYYFFSYFPDKYKNDVFKNELIISNTKLKDVILNKVLELLLSGNSLYHNKEYSLAIQKFTNLLKIENNNAEALHQIGNCYWELNKMQDAVNCYEKVEHLVSKAGKDLLFRIASCYCNIDKYDKALQYCEKIEKLNVEPSFNFLTLKAECFYELEMNEKSQKLCEEAEKYILDEVDMYRIAQLYNAIGINHRALEFAIKSVELKNNYVSGLRLLGLIYLDLFDWDKAINSLKKAYHLDKKNFNTLMTLGRAYILSNTDLKQAELLLEKALRYSKEGIFYGNLGHLYLIKNDLEKAYLNYSLCIRLLKDEKEFLKRCNIDTKYIVNIGIPEQLYIEIRDKVITDYLQNVNLEPSGSKRQ